MLARDLTTDGFALVRGVLSLQECTEAAGKITLAGPVKGGSRCLLAQEWCAAIAAKLRADLPLLIPAENVAVQCNYFEKSAGRNWLVPIHQDLSIPVSRRVDEPSLRGWSEKEGALFVQAPLEVLNELVAVRVHLDDCGPDDGPLRVVPNSHQRGIISNEDAIRARAAGLEVECTAFAGDVLILSPMLLHSSSKGSGSSRRRVLHFVFGPARLPYGLEWFIAT